MRSLKLTKPHTLLTVFVVVVVATLVMAVASTRNAMGSETLPGYSLDTLSCRQICGGGEGCAADGDQCEGTVGSQSCDNESVPGKYGYKCSSSGAKCGSGDCTGGNDYVCDGSGNSCSLWASKLCCNVTVDTCATHGDGSAEDPYSCLCDGTGSDQTVSNRVGCTPNYT